MLKSLLLCWLVASLGGVSVFLGPHRYALRKGFFYVLVVFLFAVSYEIFYVRRCFFVCGCHTCNFICLGVFLPAAATFVISHGWELVCLWLLPSQFHLVGSWGLLAAAKTAILY